MNAVLWMAWSRSKSSYTWFRGLLFHTCNLHTKSSTFVDVQYAMVNKLKLNNCTQNCTGNLRMIMLTRSAKNWGLKDYLAAKRHRRHTCNLRIKSSTFVDVQYAMTNKLKLNNCTNNCTGSLQMIMLTRPAKNWGLKDYLAAKRHRRHTCNLHIQNI